MRLAALDRRRPSRTNRSPSPSRRSRRAPVSSPCGQQTNGRDHQRKGTLMFNPDPVLVTLLQATVNSGASDLHLTVGRPPTARRDGTLVSFENVKILDHEDTARMVMS